MTDHSIVLQDNNLAMAQAVAHYNLLVEFTKSVMKLGKDFGAIPGTDKPTLLKPGAEKLCNLFEFSPDFIPLEKILDFDKNLFYFQYRCDLYRADGRKVGSGVGSCNSREKKYRYRNIPEKKATAEEKAAAIRKENKNGKYGAYTVYVVENTDPADLVNTLDKMAQKRSFIAAILIAANASEFFTQDVEDMDVIEGEFVEQPAMDPAQDGKAPIDQQPIQSGNGKAKKEDMEAIYQAVVDAGLSENTHAAKSALVNYCKTGYATKEKALAWMEMYRGWKNKDLDTIDAADKANAGEKP